jgi:uncharacterized protein YndB with AHSA1/START domain
MVRNGCFLEADALPKWLPPDAFTCTVHHLEDDGGRHVQNVVPQLHHQPQPFLRRQIKYLELVPGKRLRYTDTFDDPNLPGELR